MGLWNRGIERSKEVKRSEELCKKRGELLKKWPAINEAWEKEDSGPVRHAAQELSIVDRMENRERILEAKETLKKALWKRDTIKENFQHQMDELNGEIEALNSPVIFEKASEWQKDMSLLRDKKVIEKVKERATVDAGREITYKSNFGTIAAAKEKLVGAISQLRGMRQAPFSEVQSFIKKTEGEFLEIDFTVLTESEEVTERFFEELCSQPEVKIYTTAHMEGNRIVKDYNLPVKEFK